MREAHLSAVLAMENESFSSPWPREAFLQDLDSGESPWARSLVLLRAADPGREVRGYICFWVLEGEMSIHNIAVRPPDRRRGAAWYMLEEAFAEARRRRCRWAFLEVRPSNQAALDLYRRFGFAAVARRRAYYEDTGEDAIVMRAAVSPAPAADPAPPFLKGRRTG